jgi:hypothetical protein
MLPRRLLLASSAVVAVGLAASGTPLIGDGATAGTTDWPMWGGTPSRNMVSAAKGLPDSWDVKAKTNVKWVADLGSQTYGNAVVAGGKVFVGTNNELLRDPKQGGDRGVLMVTILSPASAMVMIAAVIAAIPEAKPRAPTAPSMSATRFSRTSVVGFIMRV